MPSSEKSSADSQPSELSKFEQAFEEAECSLEHLRERYEQICSTKQQQAALQRRSQQLQVELRQLKEQLEALEVDLESRLFSWNNHREVFWEIVRFVGLGFVLGLSFRACSG
ncbi:MAG TPA: hypothetical protein V6D03_04910 [Candidatus Caenarcaniphilales bacterium]